MSGVKYSELNRGVPSGGVDVFVVALVALSCIGGFLFGYDTGIISGALVLIRDDFALVSWQEELIVSTTVFGAMISSLGSGPFCDRYGRKPVVLASAFVFIVGAILMACASGFSLLVVGRFVVGLGVGSASMNMPIIISEMAETRIRGMLVTCINVAITGGQFVSCLVAGSLSTTRDGWRYMLGLAAIPAAIQFVGFLFMPESPRWLIENDHPELATLVLQRIRGREDVYDELEEIIAAIESERGELRRSPLGGEYTAHTTDKSQKVSISQQLSSSYIRRALFIGCCLQAGQQLGGINTVMYYSATILKLAGFTSNSEAIWLSAVVAFCNFIGSCAGLFLVDTIGRRPLTLVSQTATVFMLAALGMCFYYAQHDSTTLDNHLYNAQYGLSSSGCSDYKYCFDCVQDESCGYCSGAFVGGEKYPTCMRTAGDDDDSPRNQTVCSEADFHPNSCPGSELAGWMIFMFLCLYLLAFSPGMGTMPWCVNSEIYPTSFRGVGSSLSTAVNWSFNILMSMTFLTLINLTSKQGAFVVYALVSFLFLIIFAVYLPETKGLKLEAVKIAFGDDHWGRELCRQKGEEYGSGGRSNSWCEDNGVSNMRDRCDNDASESLLRGTHVMYDSSNDSSRSLRDTGDILMDRQNNSISPECSRSTLNRSSITTL
mmetsp:Transcript_22449/g.32745  ORF Transcript_22449/g.32745 Transcript_22449/m.32745 type:complete len:659 (+) Transcript_22449:103-2079(+)|eukprot:CAMPEP_0185027340 /NCGR_PEP_ID=MMETSP1103-20130426/12288_1 /TAXON_ID=36769 /ORGANISM="Paraphysomonas bandaiensis, Strain Caron Lab Isolate" /LENGTH=658 /DNA_ID=CAMNT_0027561295 /DNA_START=52 /DNA_END=2028 /DNA_ORIENTATION=-